MEAVSDLNWRNFARPTTDFFSVFMYVFSLNLKNFGNQPKSQILFWQIAHRATYIQWLRLQEILLTLQNEYTDWEQALQHPSNVKEQVSAHDLSGPTKALERLLGWI